jgi:hypothetical protein
MKITRAILIVGLVLALGSTALPGVAADDGVTVAVTSQRFEGGVMYWRSDTGLIWVLFNDGLVQAFPSSTYGRLRDNPFRNPPPGRVRPINGFGRVWGCYRTVRDRLGWATLPELGFVTRIVTRGSSIYLVQLDGSVVQIDPNSTWHLASTIPQPAPSAPRIVSVQAQPDPVDLGGSLQITWQVTGVDLVLIELWDTDSPNPAPFTVLTDLPLTGSSLVGVPAILKADVRIVIWGANRARGYSPVTMYERLVQSSVTVHVKRGEVKTDYSRAAFQRYERGFMIWRADTGEVMVFWGDQAGQVNFLPERAYGWLPDNPVTQATPPDRVRPINGFGRVWGNFQTIRDQLGWAVGHEEAYTTVIQSFTATGSGSFTIPDGRILYVTGTSWSF